MTNPLSANAQENDAPEVWNARCLVGRVNLGDRSALAIGSATGGHLGLGRLGRSSNNGRSALVEGRVLGRELGRGGIVSVCLSASGID